MEEEKDRWPIVRNATIATLVVMLGAIPLDLLGYLPAILYCPGSHNILRTHRSGVDCASLAPRSLVRLPCKEIDCDI